MHEFSMQNEKKILIQTYSQARMSGTRLLEVDAVRKELIQT